LPSSGPAHSPTALRERTIELVEEIDPQPLASVDRVRDHFDAVVAIVEVEAPAARNRHAQAHVGSLEVEPALRLDALVPRVAREERAQHVPADRQLRRHPDLAARIGAERDAQRLASVVRVDPELHHAIRERLAEVVAERTFDHHAVGDAARPELDAALGLHPHDGLGAYTGDHRESHECGRDRQERH
jgi:hypothetical protein